MKRPPIPKNENERLAALEALKESETKFRNIVEGSLQGFVVYRGSEALFVNQKCADIFGYDKPEEMFNMSLESMLDSCIPPEEHDRLRGYIRARAQGDPDVPDDYECPGLKRDGSPFWFENRVTTIIWDNEPALQIAVVDITERKLAEQALYEAKIRNRALLEGSPICTKIIDLDSRLQYMSTAGQKMLKIDDIEAFYGSTYPPDFFPESTRANIIECLERTKAGEITNLEFPALDTQGSEVWFQTTFVPACDDGGRTDYIIATSVDISEQMQAKEALQFTQFSVEHFAEPLFWVRSDAKFIDVNSTACESLGYTREELLEMNVHDIDPDLPVSAWEPLWDKIKTRGHHIIESSHRTKNGRIFPVEITCNYLEYGGIEYNCAIVRDISERKRTEEALHVASEEWERSFDALPEHICILDMSGTILRANETMRQHFEPIHGELNGLDYRLIYCGTASPDPQPPCAAVLSGSPPVAAESQLPTMKGWYKVASFPLFNKDKEQIGAVSVVTDITEHKQAEEELKQSQVQLRDLANQLLVAREEERTRISREIHDQLGQALTFLKMDMAWMLKQLLPEQKDLQERARNDLTLMDETLQVMRRISHDLRPAMLDDFGLEAVIEHQVGEFNQRMNSPCFCELELNTEDIGLDNKRDTVLFRILQEALTNVARYAQADKVKVTLSTLDSQLVLSIEDDGTGIRKERRRHSTSIGIIGMRERCEAIGGEFQIENIDGGGTRVICMVPFSTAA